MPRRRSVLPMVCCALILACAGCAVKLIADRDSTTEEHIFASAERVDLFYARLLDIAEDARPYAAFSTDYLTIEAHLRTLLLRNQVRQLNADSTKIAETIVNFWVKYKDMHKEQDTYTTGTARLDRERGRRAI